MSVPKKIDNQTINELRTILSKLSINQDRVTIDLKNHTIEITDDYSIRDKAWSTAELLTIAGTLTSERAKEMQEEVRKSRDEWDE